MCPPLCDSAFALYRRIWYSANMAKESKTVRYNMWLKPSVKKKLQDCAVALRLSEADVVQEALNRLHKSRDVQAALEQATDTEKETEG